MAKKDKSSVKSKSKESKKSNGKIQSKGKGGSKSSVNSDASSLWEEHLLKTAINDATYKCNVVFLVETEMLNTSSIQWFKEYAQLGLRHAVKSLGKSDMIRELKQSVLGNTHPLRGVCTAAHQQLVKGDLSVEMLAKYIKYKIIRLKEEDISHRKLLHVRAVQMKEQLLQDDIETILAERENEAAGKSKSGSGKGGKKGKGKDVKEKGMEKSLDNKKGKKESSLKKGQKSTANNKSLMDEIPDELLDKIDTKMRKRGEEWLDIEDIDDSPLNGAELYVVLTEFYDWQLIQEMMRIGVPVQAVIRAHTRDSNSTKDNGESNIIYKPKKEPAVRASMILSSCDKKDFTLSPLGNINEAETEAREQEIIAFWAEYGRLLIENDPEKQKFLQNVAIFTYALPDHVNQALNMEDWYKNSQVLYNEISKLLYDIEETSQLHVKYIRSMKVTSVDEDNVSLNLEGYDIYNTMVQLLPTECASVAFVLHCMVEQIDTTLNPAPVSEQASQSKSLDLDNNPDDAKEIKTMVEDFNTHISQLNQEYGLFQVPSTLVARRDPLVLLAGDEETLKTHHVMLPEVNLNHITSNILERSHISALWNHCEEQDESEKMKYNFHMHMLWQCMGESHISTNILSNYLHLMVCKKLECSSMPIAGAPTKIKVLQYLANCREKELAYDANNTAPTIPITYAAREGEIFTHDLECLKEMFSCPDIVDLLPSKNSSASMFESSSEMVGVQDMNANVMLQTLQAAHQDYNCFEWKYFPPTDVLLLHFHDAMNEEGYRALDWKAPLRTPVAFRDFQEYVIEEEAEWAQLNITKVESTLLMTEKTEHPDTTTQSVHSKPSEKDFIQEEDFLLTGSIKHDLLLAKNAATLPTDEVKTPKGKKDTSKKKETKSKEKIEKKTGTKEKSSKKGKDAMSMSKESKEMVKPELEVTLPVVKRLSLRSWYEGEPFMFVGYNFGPLQVQISGTTTYFFSADGTKVRTRCAGLLYGEQVCAIEHTHQGHLMTFHSIAGPMSPAIQIPVVFHVTSSFGAILAFEKHYKKPDLVASPTAPDEGEVELKETLFENTRKKNRKNSHESSTSSTGGKRDKKGSGKSPKKKSLKTAEKPRQVIEHEFHNLSNIVEDTELPKEKKDTIPPPPAQPWNYLLRASWPSGLMLETVLGPDYHDPFRIKQWYLQKGPQCDKIRDEDYRIFLKNGTVLKFMNNDSVEILLPDSTVVLCKSFHKPVEKQDSFLIVVNPDNQSEQDGINVCYEVIDPKPPRLPLILPSLSPLMDITDYHVILPSGKQYHVKDGEINNNYDKFLLRRATDFFLGEVFTRRGDGTHTLLQPDGKLIGAFPDGTRITTWFTIDDEPLMVEWTEEEKAKIRSVVFPDSFVPPPFSDTSYPIHEHTHIPSPRLIDKSSSAAQVTDLDTDQEDNELELHEEETDDRFDDLFNHDEFVSVNLVSCVEHPNYSTVTHRNGDRSAVIEMPHDMKITISPEGLYTANIDDSTNLKVAPDKITFSSRVCGNCSVTSKSVVNLAGFKTSGTEALLSKTTDSHGQTFKVHYDGSTQLDYKKHSIDEASLEEVNLDCSLYKSYDMLSDVSTAEEFTIHKVSQPDKFCLPDVKYKPKDFVLKRDLTGSEFIDAESLEKYLEAARELSGGAVVTDNLQNTSQSDCSVDTDDKTTRLQYHTILAPVLKTESEKWLMECKSKHVLPHNMRKKDLRSTYGDPPTWYHPLPLKKTTTEDDESERNDGRGEEIVIPEVFTLRVVQEMQHPLLTMMDGLIKYREIGLEKTAAYSHHPMEDTRTSSQKAIEHHLLRQALGESFVSLQDLFRRRHRPPQPPRTEAKQHPEQMQHLAECSKQNAVDKDAYQRLLREHNVPPYFQSQPGESFLAVMKALKTAMVITEDKTETKKEKTEGAEVPAKDTENLVVLLIEH